MKLKSNSVFKSFCVYFASVGIVTAAAATTITFDDLGSVSSATPIPNGYAGFQWSNFDYLDSRTAGPSGFQNGVVSPYNVAFNQGGAAAGFSSATPFNFDSAYLTGAWNDGLQV